MKRAKGTFEIALIKQTDVPAIVYAAACGHRDAQRLACAIGCMLRRADLCMNPDCHTEFSREEIPALIVVARPYAAASDVAVGGTLCRVCAGGSDEEISDRVLRAWRKIAPDARRVEGGAA
jgi:hypothetical protein